MLKRFASKEDAVLGFLRQHAPLIETRENADQLGCFIRLIRFTVSAILYHRRTWPYLPKGKVNSGALDSEDCNSKRETSNSNAKVALVSLSR